MIKLYHNLAKAFFFWAAVIDNSNEHVASDFLLRVGELILARLEEILFYSVEINRIILLDLEVLFSVAVNLLSSSYNEGKIKKSIELIFDDKDFGGGETIFHRIIQGFIPTINNAVLEKEYHDFLNRRELIYYKDELDTYLFDWVLKDQLKE